MKKLFRIFLASLLSAFSLLSKFFGGKFKFAFFATQGQMAFDEGEFNFDNTKIGIIDIELGEEASEIDVSDTETDSGESEYLAGKTNRSISFTGFHKSGQPTLPTKIDKTFSIVAVDEAGLTTTFAGTAKLLTKTISGARDGAFQVAYSGRIQGSMSEDTSSS